MPDWSALGDDLLDDLFTGDVVADDFGERYQLLGALGRGGQGSVFHARDGIMDRDVAIKVAHTAEAAPWLLGECRLLARLAHPAIPQTYDRGTTPDGRAFLVLQLVRGQRLDQALPPRGWAWRDALAHLRPVAEAVAHAHGHGVLHRDLKPENILLDESSGAVVVDWGLAATGDPRAICGSPHYAAPEQLDGQVADVRVDIFALGVLLYLLCCGELPYGRRVHDFHEFRRMRAGLQQVPLRERREDVPAAVERIWRRATAAQPAARYRDVASLLADMRAVESGQGLANDPRKMPRRGIAMVIAVLLALAVGGVVGNQVQRLSAVRPPQAGPDSVPWQQAAGLPHGDAERVAALVHAAVVGLLSPPRQADPLRAMPPQAVNVVPPRHQGAVETSAEAEQDAELQPPELPPLENDFWPILPDLPAE